MRRPASAAGCCVPATRATDEARRTWNGAIDRFPAVVARCAGAGDVQAALRVGELDRATQHHGLASSMARTTDTVRAVTGRAPRPFAAFARDRAASFAGGGATAAAQAA